MNRLVIAVIAFLFSVCGIASASEKNVSPKNSNENSPGNGFHLTFFMNQPASNNLVYAVFVSGPQPNTPTWENQLIDPSYSPAFDVGYNHFFKGGVDSIAVDWSHFNSRDVSSKQANPNLNIFNVEFVAPPYDVGPQSFAIKHVTSNVKFYFDRVSTNWEHLISYSRHLNVHVFGGIDYLRIQQDITTTFDQNTGVAPTVLTPLILPNPSWFFTTQNLSTFNGGGPDAGLTVSYEGDSGFGVVAELTGILAVGSQSTYDNFTAFSVNLNGINRQFISIPNQVQLVPALDSKVGMLFKHQISQGTAMSFELGYRFASYLMSISEIAPESLVQVGLTGNPSFVLGTMAINTTATYQSYFNLSGPYVTLEFTFI